MSNFYPQQEQDVISSPTSTESLLLDYLRPQLERADQTEEIYQIHQESNDRSLFPSIDQCFSKPAINNIFGDEEHDRLENGTITLELTNFSDLQIALKDIGDLEPNGMKHQQQKTTDEDLINFSGTEFIVPASVRVNIENSQIMDMLMDRAQKHWCCIGFKVAPISVTLIKNWRKAPAPIVYCIASISLVTFMNEEIANNDLYFKQAAMVFYEQAKNKLDDITFDDMKPIYIQSYFCLSYTSNLLRLYEQQRTWGGLASISLKHLAENHQSRSKPLDNVTLGCWFRWYYVDAWMCLSLNRESLLPDTVPWVNMDNVAKLSLAKLQSDQHNLYSFAYLTWYMRRYIQALHSCKIFKDQQQKSPSNYYYTVTQELTSWYSQLPKYDSISELHLHLCYNSMRLVVLYQFLNPQLPPPYDILIDCLETNLELLQALQHLKALGCDQSTYHHMFFAIHNTAKRIFQYEIQQFKPYAEEQLKINLMLLKSTQAYAHDVFKVKIYAQKIQDQFTRMRISIPQPNPCNFTVFKQKHNNLSRQLVSPQPPVQIVFKNEQQRALAIKRNRSK